MGSPFYGPDGQLASDLDIGANAAKAVAQDIGGSAGATIVSGISRVQNLAKTAAPVLSEFEALVATMTGKSPAQAGVSGTGSTVSAGTAGAINDGVSLLESFVSRIGALVKSARAAHG